MNDLIVSEQFLSVQCEGRTVGIPSYFLRLKSCNILCGGKGTDKDKKLHDGATWRCDTVEVWLKGDKKSYNQIADGFGSAYYNDLKKRSHHLVITGGEPMMKQHDVLDYINFLMGSIARIPIIEIETNGTIMPNVHLSDFVQFYNVSPKLSNSGVPVDKRYKPQVLQAFNNLDQTIFKFVISNVEDVREAQMIIDEVGLNRNKVYFMPAADNDKALIDVSKQVIAYCLDSGYKFSPRLHIAIWNQKTGV